MTSPRTHRRRSSRDWDDDEDNPTLLEILISSFTDRLARSAVDRVRHGVQGIVHWTTSRLIACWIGTAVLMAGVVLVLFAGVKGLQALDCPLWLACLSMGVLALAGALVMLRGMKPSEEDEYLD
jgi:hypothetical protein